MTDQTGGDQPQKTVAELLAQHGAQVDGGSRRRRRRAAEDDDEVGTPDPGTTTGSHRRPGVSDTGSQAIIDRVNADNGMPPARPAAPPRRRPEPQPPAPQAQPRPMPQESQQLPRPVAQPPARPVTESSGYQRMPQESGQYSRPPQESGQFARPPQESQQLPAPQRAPRRQPPPPPQPSQQMPVPQPSQQMPVPQPSQQMPVPPADEKTRAVPPVAPPARRRPSPPPAPPAPGAQSTGALSSRLDGLNGTPDAELDGPPMASGQFGTPPPPAPQRPRRAPVRRPPQPKEAHTEQFSKVTDDVDVPPPPAPPKPPKTPKAKPGAVPDISSPAGLANWRKRRQKEQLEDTEIGVMPAVHGEEEFDQDDFAPESSGYQAAYDEGPPTGTYPPPMPFAPDERAPRGPVPDDLSEYEHEFAEPVGYPAGSPDFDRDDYGYEQGEDYEDEYDEDVAGPAPEPAAAVSPGKAWLALAGQLALGVIGGAAVWLGFNWLWVSLPAAALVAALVVVVALVWIVRKIRRAEDLQTTVLAVLVGLVVTVSPAALLLVGR